jgi:hypothetical protein
MDRTLSMRHANSLTAQKDRSRQAPKGLAQTSNYRRSVSNFSSSPLPSANEISRNAM